MSPLLTVIPTPGLVGSEAGFGASLVVQLPSAAQAALTVSLPAATLILAPPLQVPKSVGASACSTMESLKRLESAKPVAAAGAGRSSSAASSIIIIVLINPHTATLPASCFLR
eukprot:COSAG04_NODE_529_length_13029_cov_3.203248_11_plen_113_part_00